MDTVAALTGISFGLPDFSNTDWSQLWNVRGFKWVDNVTPFSQPELPLIAVAVYFVVIYGLQKFMESRKPLEMSKVSAVHNLILCIWSIAMSAGTLVGAYTRSQEHGIECLVCEKDLNAISGSMYYWSLIYHYSKYYELLDTVIIALRKRPIIFLHVYHHIVMVVLTRMWLHPGHPLHWWSVFLNSFVHIFMYYFYFLSSLGKTVWWKRYITQLQLVQFGIFASVMCLYFVKYIGVFSPEFNFWHSLIAPATSCVGPLWIVYVTMLFNFSLILLFSRFYERTYDAKKAPVTKGKKKN